MKTTNTTASACAAIIIGCTAILGFNSARAATVVPLTGTTIIPGQVIGVGTTTAIGNGIPSTGIVIPPGTTMAILSFNQPFATIDASVNVGGFSSVWFVVGNTLTTTTELQAAEVASRMSATGQTSITVAKAGGGLPIGSSIETLTFIPEPSSAVLGALGFAFFLRRRRA